MDGTCCATASCAPRESCAIGACIPLQPNGTPCAAGDVCLSGFCVDGVCCADSCSDRCETCNDPALGPGACAPHPPGADPEAECPGSSTCDGGGTCSGGTPLGAPCAFDVECATGHCSDGVCCEIACDGACETCQFGPLGPGACAPHPAGTDPEGGCQGTPCDGSGQCTGACVSDAQCRSDRYCDGGSCVGKLPDGFACAAGNQCASGHCADGVCCDTACDGTCETCNAGGAPGRCTFTPAGSNPGGECPGGSICTGGGACAQP